MSQRGNSASVAAVDSLQTPPQQPLPPSNATPKITQPVPQVRTATSSSSILVSPRQRGNPVLAFLKSQPWEYGEIVADYVVGATTCALFLSLKYHRLHPEYIYTRIRNLQGKYNLRILLTMVDIPNHEDALRELSKTSVVYNMTVMLCWSAAEAARYLEFYKSYENSDFAAIKGHRTMSYAERLIEFVTVPRSINKADAVALVSNFGSLRNAINGDPEEISMIGGWGGVKVKRWSSAVQEPFMARAAATSSRGQQQQGQGDDEKGRTKIGDNRPNNDQEERGDATTGNNNQGGPGDVGMPSWPPGQQEYHQHGQPEESRAIQNQIQSSMQQIKDDNMLDKTATLPTEPAPRAPQDQAAPSGTPVLAPGVAMALAQLRQE